MSAAIVWHDDLDVQHAERLLDDVDGALARFSDGDTMVLDVSAVQHLDSTGISALLNARSACTAAGITLVVRGLADRCKRVLALSGLSRMFLFDDGAGLPGSTTSLPGSTLAPAAPDPMFDQIAALTRRVLGVPVALVSLVDTTQQVFPGAVGLPDPWQDTRCTPLTHSFCQYVVADRRPLVISDARTDQVLRHNLAVPDLGVVAYAGMPLTDVDDLVVGSLCAIDSVPRAWTETELTNLADLAAACSAELHKRGAARRAAVSVDRERIAREVHEHVLGELFATTMTLAKARSLVNGRAEELMLTAIGAIDGAIDDLRRSIFSRKA